MNLDDEMDDDLSRIDTTGDKYEIDDPELSGESNVISGIRKIGGDEIPDGFTSGVEDDDYED